MGAVGTSVVAFLLWGLVLMFPIPFVLEWREPVYAVQEFVWFMAGFQISGLLGRAVEIRSRQQSLNEVDPPATLRPSHDSHAVATE